jgi:cytidine deaminase
MGEGDACVKAIRFCSTILMWWEALVLGCPEDLLSLATTYIDNAYAPYSGYRVVAVLRDEHDRVFVGVNVENPSYGLTVCAERVALFSAVTAGARRFKEILVYTSKPPPPIPCGACLQALSAFDEGGLRVYVHVGGGLCESFALAELLPRPFRL